MNLCLIPFRHLADILSQKVTFKSLTAEDLCYDIDNNIMSVLCKHFYIITLTKK